MPRLPKRAAGRPAPIIKTLYALLGKLSLLLVALAATTTAVYPVSPPPPSVAQILADNPVLRRVSACESTGNPDGTPRQFNADGSPLWGNDPTTGKPIQRDLGEFQINTWVWERTAEKVGDDLF